MTCPNCECHRCQRNPIPAFAYRRNPINKRTDSKINSALKVFESLLEETGDIPSWFIHRVFDDTITLARGEDFQHTDGTTDRFSDEMQRHARMLRNKRLLSWAQTNVDEEEALSYIKSKYRDYDYPRKYVNAISDKMVELMGIRIYRDIDDPDLSDDYDWYSV